MYVFEGKTWNDACGCHPEYRSIQTEASSLPALAALIAESESYFTVGSVPPISKGTLYLRTDLPPEDLFSLAQLVIPERVKIAEAEKAKKLLVKEQERSGALIEMRKKLDRERPDLNEDAIRRREAAILEFEARPVE